MGGDVPVVVVVIGVRTTMIESPTSILGATFNSNQRRTNSNEQRRSTYRFLGLGLVLFLLLALHDHLGNSTPRSRPPTRTLDDLVVLVILDVLVILVIVFVVFFIIIAIVIVVIIIVIFRRVGLSEMSCHS